MKFTAICLAAAATAGMLWAQAGPGRFGRNGRGERGLQFLSDYLDLTAQQKEQAKALFESVRTANEPYAAELRQTFEQARSAVRAGKSEAELQQIAGSIGPVVSQMAANHLKNMAKFYNSLSQPQKDKLERLHQGVRSHIEQRFRGQVE
ncbi:MAG: Spy/CpxP family protein refolding chaperone [Acidobacteria bacterium]|nr:Spy/CpxP family protein refolding chaperone [Acidobacteriota bacterium]